jgi:hypothetical protein
MLLAAGVGVNIVSATQRPLLVYNPTYNEFTIIINVLTAFHDRCHDCRSICQQSHRSLYSNPFPCNNRSCRLTRPVCATAPMTSDCVACLWCMHMHRLTEGSTSSDCWTAARLCTRVIAAAPYVHLMARRAVGPGIEPAEADQL